jgi:energy-coupling factor transporter ATP-binding protein EcfA2
MTPADLRIEGLRFSYPAQDGDPPAVLFQDLSFRLDAGATGVLLGPADLGKTTLARILVGLVPRFTGGEISGELHAGRTDLRAAQPYDLVETIGLVFQDSEAQVLTTRCDTELAFALESLGMPRDQIAARIDRSLEALGLSNFRARNPSTLSGGERKRLLIACLAAIEPSIWVLDESLDELDEGWKLRVLDLLTRLRATALVLDSRWTALHESIGSRYGVIADRAISCLSNQPVSTELRAALVREGIMMETSAGARRRPRPQGAPFLRAEGVRYTFPEPDAFALDVDSIVVEKGTVCALVGPNGSGKSTLGRVLCGLLKPQGGTVSLNDGAAFHAADPEELNRRIGYLFQNPDHQIYLPTIEEELSLGLKRKGIAKRQIDDLVREAVSRFRLPGMTVPPALMSYGARRRLQAATYWLLERDMLILDEVDSGLSFRDLESLMYEICGRTSCVVLITHDREYALSVADRVMTMEGGRLVRDSRTEAS